ncbi:hypothetical protein EII29_09670 [Leptotrichia sp. OH3620_COT-345]|uniref:hypothetical protein n=1 Tax=Leptotrichia sp. OH3620_COT-345 TaxID=2491048 RepID=UPI000F64D48B|nr:hypothetical protein [Leptotrichia sp. OH3620_COT-345]RRD38783.1 hypothetical protein EII29_09670 [Leptotrichia sp. OH3620_COT-345]
MKGGARKGSGRKKISEEKKRKWKLNFELSFEERNFIQKKLDDIKEKKRLKSRVEALLEIFNDL